MPVLSVQVLAEPELSNKKFTNYFENMEHANKDQIWHPTAFNRKEMSTDADLRLLVAWQLSNKPHNRKTKYLMNL